MTTTVVEAETNLSELIRRAKTGEEVVITSGEDGTPAVRLVPVETPAAQAGNPAGALRRIGALKHLNIHIPEELFAPLTDAEMREYFGDAFE